MSEHILLTLSKKLFENQDNQLVYFVDNKDANNLLNDLENMPHAFVLGCLMDRKSRVERTWLIPYRIKELVGTFEINELAEITREEYVNLFTNNNLHRFNNEMALVFHSAVQEIKKKYNGDVSRIWSNNPGSAKVVYEFLQFYGCGIKIATMAANILATRFKIRSLITTLLKYLLIRMLIA